MIKSKLDSISLQKIKSTKYNSKKFWQSAFTLKLTTPTELLKTSFYRQGEEWGLRIAKLAIRVPVLVWVNLEPLDCF